jgi:hypothetical protein
MYIKNDCMNIFVYEYIKSSSDSIATLPSSYAFPKIAATLIYKGMGCMFI